MYLCVFAGFCVSVCVCCFVCLRDHANIFASLYAYVCMCVLYRIVCVHLCVS